MEQDYFKTEEYKKKKRLHKLLKFLMLMRILAALVMVGSVFLFIWCDWLFALRMLLTGLAAGLFLWGFYDAVNSKFYKEWERTQK